MKIYCACGCGAQFENFDKWGRPRKFLSSHNSRILPLSDRFLKLVDMKSENECWNWLGRKNNLGYGFLDVVKNGRPRPIRAHRISYELFKGKFTAEEKGLFVCHHCDNPSCVNPHHLFLGTAKDNMQDAVNKGRIKGNGLSGEDVWLAKLNRHQVKELRELYAIGDYSQRDLAKLYKVSQSSISAIILRKTHRNY